MPTLFGQDFRMQRVDKTIVPAMLFQLLRCAVDNDQDDVSIGTIKKTSGSHNDQARTGHAWSMRPCGQLAHHNPPQQDATSVQVLACHKPSSYARILVASRIGTSLI